MRKFALALRTIFMASAVCASLPAVAAPEIPPELRALFVEAEDMVKLTTLQNMPKRHQLAPTKIFWLDNHRLIYTVRKFNGWEARKDERSKIIVYDTETGKSEEAPYRGNLVCLGPEGEIAVQDYPVPFPGYLLPGDSGREDLAHYLIGKFGQPLTRIKRPKEQGMFDYFSCQPYSNANHDFGAKHISTPLRKGDGILDEVTYGAPDNMVRLVSPEGKTQWEIETDTLCNYFGKPKYLPWSDRYFAGTAWGNVAPGCMELNKNSWLFSTREIEVKPLPRLIQEIRKPETKLGGGGATYWARPGMFVFVQFSAYKLLDGLYWNDEQSGQLKRVLRKPWGLDDLSPDGCRNLVMVTPPVIMELCKGQKQ